MDSDRQLAWIKATRRLDAAYAVGGTEALTQMTGIEIYALYAEKMAELAAVRKSLVEHGSNEISQLHKQKLEQQTTDMASWMRVHCSWFREAEQRAAKRSLAELKAQGTGKQPARQQGRHIDRDR